MAANNSHIEQVRANYHYWQWQVLWLTGMSEAQYANFMYETGVQWLCRFAGANDDAATRAVLSQPEVWQWWKNEWNRRNETYLPALYDCYQHARKEVEARYRALHQETFIRWSPPYNLLSKYYSEILASVNNH